MVNTNIIQKNRMASICHYKNGLQRQNAPSVISKTQKAKLKWPSVIKKVRLKIKMANVTRAQK